MLFVVPWDLSHPGGVNQVVISLYREFERSGPYQPLVLVLDWMSPSATKRSSGGCRTIHLQVREPPEDGGAPYGTLVYLLRLPVTIFALWRLIARHHVRAVNLQYPTLAALNFVLLRKLGLFDGEILLSFHGLDIRNTAQRKGLAKLLWRLLARNSDAFIACSESLAAELRAFFPRQARRVLTVPNGIDTEALLEERRSLSSVTRQPPKRPFILNVATFEHKKGQDVLVKAFARIAKDIDADLVMIGRDGPAREPVEALVTELRLADRVCCITNMPHAEVLAYMEKATLFALPSRAEGMPIVLFEASVFGLPVVASRADGIPEVVSAPEFGILVEPEDDLALAEALRKLLSDAEVRAALGSRLKTRVATTFTWRQAWQRYVGLLGQRSTATSGTPSLREGRTGA